MSTFAPNQWVNLTQKIIARAPLPAHGQTFLRDAALKGFGVRLTARGTRAFILEKRIDRRVKRITLGHVGELSLPQARRKAQQYLGTIAMGQNPVADAHRARLQAITLEQCFQDYLKMRKGLKPRTVYDYGRYMATAFHTWRRSPLIRISKDQIGSYHRELGETHGEYYANGAMRFLRALFNFALGQYEDGFGNSILKENPVLRLTRTRAWYPTDRRRTVIRPHQLSAWYQAVEALRVPDHWPAGDTAADYLLLLLFTGLRRTEAAQLRWVDVDLADKTLTIPEPKNHEPLTLPLSDSVMEILARRKREAASPWVFPGNGRRGYVIEVRRQMRHVTAQSGVAFTLHDLRRTFATLAESLDISPYAIKRLMNHTFRSDVTGGYIVPDVTRLRAPAQKIADFLNRAFSGDSRANVVSLAARPSVPMTQQAAM